MKVKELISLLSEQDPDMIVVVDGYEDGYNNISKLEKVKIKLNLRKREGEYNWEGDWNSVYKETDCFDHFAINIPR